ncbi:MAG: DUF1858 domain-containing protein [Candidatus Brocadiaceae bacterium]|nr:DUF1858 domain-containing protein [Candidatus Brocadiaceae bacterium]
MEINKDSKVLNILKAHPSTVKVFHKFRIHPVHNINRTLETITRDYDTRLEELLAELNATIQDSASTRKREATVKSLPKGEWNGRIDENTTFRYITTRYPATLQVFERHGVLGLAREHWADREVLFFAMALLMAAEELIKEIQAAVDRNKSAQVATTRPPEPALRQNGAGPTPESTLLGGEGADTASYTRDLHVPFVKAAIAFAMTTGCLYGAGALAYMALNGHQVGIPRAMLEAHGHTQVYGWVGLFIMGVSYFALPRFWNTTLYKPFFAHISFFPMLIGISLVFLSRHLLLLGDYLPFRAMGILGSLVETAAIVLFIYLLAKTYRSVQGRRFEVYEGYFFAGYAWFLLQSLIFVGTIVYLARTGGNTIPRLVEQPLLHLQIMGFACMVILGILTKTLPVFLGIKEPGRTINLWVLFLLNISIALRAISLPLKELHPLNPLFSHAFLLSGCMEGLAVLMFFYNLRLHRIGELESGAPRREFRKFIKAALFWFFVAEAGLLTFTLHQFTTGQGVSYAMFGAYRHAIFVGFISMMIVGCASKMIPMSLGTQLYSYRALFWTFVLLNLGNLLRVTCQPLAVDYHMNALFLPLGLSGFLEYTGLCLFGYNIWKTVAHREAIGEKELTGRITVVTPETNVYLLVKQHPQCLDILVNRGFTPLKNPLMLNTVAKTINLGTAASIHPVDLGSLLKELNEAIPQNKVASSQG